METFMATLIKRFHYISVYLIVIPALMALIAAGCGGDDNNEAAAESTTGTLTLSLMDAASDEYKAVYVTISEVRAQLAEEGSDGDVDEDNPDTTDWEIVASNPGTYNLLELVNGVMEQLGVTELATGHYPQMRLYLGDTPDETTNILEAAHPYANYVVTNSDEYQELKVPSGYQSGIKLVNAFDIEAGVTKELVLDFDVSKSIVTAGNSGKKILKPTIKVIDVINRPVITGIIYEADGTTPIPGVYVTAQAYDPDATDAKDRVVVSAGTISDDNGEYRIILEEGLTYNIVAYMEGYAPNYMELENAQLNASYEDRNINLSVASAITIPISVNISGDPEEGEVQTAAISFRQDAGDTQIEVVSANIEDSAGTTDVNIILPAGTYDIIASSDGFAAQTNEDIAISSGYRLDVVF